MIIILDEKNKTGKWLAEQLGKDPSTISKWCSNSSQQQLDTMIHIAELLEVDIEALNRYIAEIVVRQNVLRTAIYAIVATL